MRLFAVLMLGLSCVVGCSRSPVRGTPVAADRDPARDVVAADDRKDGKKEESGPPFKLPGDAAGKLLGQVLPPTPRPGALNSPTRAVPPAATPPRLATLEPALPDVPGPRPVPPKERSAATRPAVVTEEAVDEAFDVPTVPVVPSFETLKKERERSESVHVPPPLPYLATRPDDPVPLDDPTFEASVAATLAAPLPERTRAVPFTVITVPEPFELRRPASTPPLEEGTGVVAGTPVVPKK